MQYDVSRIDTDYHFNITGVSYIGNPRSNTVMYIGRKIAEQLKKLDVLKNSIKNTDLIKQVINYEKSMHMHTLLLD